MITGRARSEHDRRAFTLVELALVIAVTAILAVSAIPAFGVLNGVREASGAECVERFLLSARSRAVCGGRPIGVWVEPDARLLRVVEISGPGAAPTPSRGVFGEVEPELNFAADYPGVTLSDVTGFGGETGAQILWFGHDGAPQRRDVSGVLQAAPSTDAEVHVAGYIVRVRRGSGAITR